MTIHVYFGPYRRSPAKPVSGDEATLSIQEFGVLRGYARDFWTNNPFVLDVFPPEQIMLWSAEWVPLMDAAKMVVPATQLARVRRMQPGRLALTVEAIRLMHERASTGGPGVPALEQAISDMRQTLLQ